MGDFTGTVAPSIPVLTSLITLKVETANKIGYFIIQRQQPLLNKLHNGNTHNWFCHGLNEVDTIFFQRTIVNQIIYPNALCHTVFSLW